MIHMEDRKQKEEIDSLRDRNIRKISLRENEV